MRHIPEDELHSYLDQALSRSQCVEIESHLAHCSACRGSRDGIAALRDRTTSLLSSLTPVRHRIPPSWSALSRQAAERSSRRSSRHLAFWAASIVAALGLGWGAQSLMHRPPAAGLSLAQATPSPLPVQPDVRPVPVSGPAAVFPMRRDSATRAGQSLRTAPAKQTEPTLAASARTLAPGDTLPDPSPSEPVGTRLSTGRLPSTDFEFAGEGMWRTLSWDNAKRERGESVPRIRGLPVVEVQVGTSRDSSGEPTMIVAQQLRSGQLIRTIEGPATDVTRLLASQHAESKSPWPTVQDSMGLSDGTMAMVRGDRMLAIQASPSVPADSLRAMIRRLNAANR